MSLSDIQEVISKSNKPFTSAVLHPLFQGKSINTPTFMLAVLLNEGLVKRSKRCYEWIDPGAFMDSLKPPAKKASTKPKTAPKTTAKTAP